MVDGSGEERQLRPSSRGVPRCRDACTRVLLVGFMCSGKTAVGREVARVLGWPFVDFDEEVERVCGIEIARIFEEIGESRFREVEAEVGERLLRGDKVVLASGGGWPARPGRMEGVPGGTLTVWLEVTPETAVERARAQPGRRPLLAVEEPLKRAQALLIEREPYYGRSELSMGSDGASISELAQGIVRVVGELNAPRALDSITDSGRGS